MRLSEEEDMYRIHVTILFDSSTEKKGRIPPATKLVAVATNSVKYDG